MRTSSVSRTQMGSGGFRFDASFHMSDGIQARRALSKLPYDKISIGQTLLRSFYGGRDRRVYVTDPARGIPFLGGSTMLKADLNGVKLISKKLTANLEEMILKKDWILISRSGTIGKCVYSCNVHSGMAASEHIIRLVPNHTIPSGVLYAYLSSKYGYALLTQGMFGSVIQEIEPEYVESLNIPVFPEALQKKVHALITESARLREEASTALKNGVHLLEDQIKIPVYQYRPSAVSLNKILHSQNKRIDAGYHVCEGDAIQKYIQNNFVYKTLGELSEKFWRPDIFKRYYVKQGVMFLGSSDILLATPESKKFLSEKRTDISALAVDENWILIPRSGTIGDCILTNSQHAQKLVSEHVIRFKSNNILTVEYIFAFLNSNVGKPLIRKHMFGSVIQHVEPPLLSTIPVPIIDMKYQKLITDFISEYRKKMGLFSAKQSQAISDIEEEIEKWQK